MGPGGERDDAGRGGETAAQEARDTGLEINRGTMADSVLKAAVLRLKVRLVHVSPGKCARTEPIALKSETGGDHERLGRSPDRADARVWGMTVLSETRSGVPRVRRLPLNI